MAMGKVWPSTERKHKTLEPIAKNGTIHYVHEKLQISHKIPEDRTFLGP